MKLEAKHRFSHMSNSTEYIKITLGMSKWVNSRWLPKWPPKALYDYNFCFRADSQMKLVAKHRFSSISNSTSYIKSTSDMSKKVNLRWPPRWLPLQQTILLPNQCLPITIVPGQIA